MGYSFNGTSKIITLTVGTILLDVKDLYSRWKDWVLTSDNSKWETAFQVTGGDEIDSDSGTAIPLYAFLINGWVIKPQESNHTLNVFGGVLLVSGGGDPFVDTAGNYMIRINYQQPVQAITVSTSGAGPGPIDANLIQINGETAPVDNLENDYNGTGYAKPNSTVGPIDYKVGSVNDFSATTTSFVGNSGLSNIDDFYNGSVLAFTSGVLQGIAERISNYVGSTRTIQFDTALPIDPENGDNFIIIGVIV